MARALEYTGPTDDGMFWMEWKDCQAYFKNLDFCSRWVRYGTVRFACMLAGAAHVSIRHPRCALHGCDRGMAAT